MSKNDQIFNDATVETAARRAIEWCWVVVSLLYVTINNSHNSDDDDNSLGNIVMIMTQFTTNGSLIPLRSIRRRNIIISILLYIHNEWRPRQAILDSYPFRQTKVLQTGGTIVELLTTSLQHHLRWC